MIRRTQHRRMQSNAELEFQRLEPRNMLTQLAVDIPAQNLVVNGDFESFVKLDNTNFYDNDNVPGWHAIDGSGNDVKINLHTHDNENGTILDLDSNDTVFDTVFQDINTVLGQQYILAFEFVGQPFVSLDQDPLTNDFEVFWNNELIGTFTGVDSIQTAAFRVLGGSLPQAGGQPDDTTKTRLEFRDMRGEDDRTGDWRGALIDNVRLVEASTSEITNGSFESTNSDKTRFFQPDDVDGWSAMGVDAANRLLQIEDSLSFAPDATDGNQYLNLDTKGDHVDRIFQFVDTVPGETYFITFDMRVDGPQNVNRDELRVRWNDDWAATFIGGNLEFQNYGLVATADSESTLLVFREPGEAPGDGSGPLIDNVRIFQVDRVINDLQVDIDPVSNGLNGNANFVEGNGPTNIASNVQLSHASGDVLTYAAVTNLNILNPNQEFLTVDVGSTGITQTYDPATGLLELRGSAAIGDYQTVLRTLTYNNTADNPASANRTIAISITDANILVGDNFSGRSLIDLSVSSTNDAPEIAFVSDRSTDFGLPLVIEVEATDGDNDNLSFSLSHSQISFGHNTPSIDSDGQISWSPSEAGRVDLTVRATDPSGEFAERTFAVTVQPFQPFSGSGSLSQVPARFRENIYDSQPGLNIDTSKSYQAVIDTTAGVMRYDLLDDTADVTVNNFINLSLDGYFDGVGFHRVIDNFVAQGGDPTGTGRGGPGYSFIDENPTSTFAAGDLAMANSGPNTNGSQFFVAFDPLNLVTSHTLFGRITDGQSVLDQIVRTHVIAGNNEVPTGNAPTLINSITIIEL